MWLAEGLTSIDKDNSADFLGETKYNEQIGGGGGGGFIFLKYKKKI